MDQDYRAKMARRYVVRKIATVVVVTAAVYVVYKICQNDEN